MLCTFMEGSADFEFPFFCNMVIFGFKPRHFGLLLPSNISQVNKKTRTIEETLCAFDIWHTVRLVKI